jgi:hypothetical protein
METSLGSRDLDLSQAGKALARQVSAETSAIRPRRARVDALRRA